MGSILLIVLGVAIVVFTLIDIFWTTFWIDGADGPITWFVTLSIWWVHRNTLGKINNKLLSLSGAYILTGIFLSWVALLFMGWLLIFLSNDKSVIDSQTGEVTNLVDKVYFVAYSLFTLGNGDLKPSKGVWQVLTPCVTGAGFATLTLGITYLISLLSAAVNKMNVASKITSIGETAEDFVIELWKGKQFNSIELVLNTILSELSMLNEQHKAYPALHYFHTAEYKKSVAYALGVLFDALNILEFGLEEKEIPSPSILYNCRRTIDDYLDTISTTRLAIKTKKSPPISIEKVKNAEIRTIDEDEFFKKINEFEEKRKLLYGMVKNDGWDWYSVIGKECFFVNKT